MPDKFYPISLKKLLELILHEVAFKDSYFGIPGDLFYRPLPFGDNPLATRAFGQPLDNPLGVAAGPHTQMAQNIVGAWLMGARYIELKTIQTLDELEVPKPCIDMQDEGYNCEWSQELKVRQSFDEYLNAWIIIHVLNHHFGWPAEMGTVFNMSVGYDLNGIRQDNVQWFLDQMCDCSEYLHPRLEEIREVYPDIDRVNIPRMISNSVTLSTMHGCPAGEIEAIARYLMEQKGLHTYVKLNPTLLGPETLRGILNDRLGFATVVPDQAFVHDLKYDDALGIIHNLNELARSCSLDFGLKLTNTLESENHREVFGSAVENMYMSGRALHPLAISLANRLQRDFGGRLSLSFSAGGDTFNVAEVFACGFQTLTVCSDLLKPGGYMRLHQYIEELINKAGGNKVKDNAFTDRLQAYADKVMEDPAYRCAYLLPPNIKTSRPLGLFDCIAAPCRDGCATNQDIPAYMHFAANGQYDEAMKAILRTNPFPTVTGMVCDHLCQNSCTRTHYDAPLLIREIKRFLSENGKASLQPEPLNGFEAAIIGAGPAGLSCAFFLALAGFEVDVYEARSRAGGMVQYAIPGFRLSGEAFEKDLQRIKDLGVRIHYNAHVDKQLFKVLREKCHYVFIGAGAQLSAPLNIPGIEHKGVVDPLTFLMRVKQGQEAGIGRHVVIIGGGNTAMDTARTAWRLVGADGSVTVVYRRTISEMPADQGEIKAVMEEGVNIIELAGPEAVIAPEGNVTRLRCSRMELSHKDESGRRKPVKVPGSFFDIPCDTIIPAVGQLSGIDFLEPELLETTPGQYLTKVENIYIGGDALRGASTAINAVGDGRKAAEQIMKDADYDFMIAISNNRKPQGSRELMVKRSRRVFGPEVREVPVGSRRNFHLVQQPLTEEDIKLEASRCLLCDELCNSCVTVCPNFANYAYEVHPFTVNLQKVVREGRDGGVTLRFDGVFELSQSTQIINIANFCNECGNCNTFCPSAGAPYRDKPRLHLSADSFAEANNGYFFERLPGKIRLIHKEKERVNTLTQMIEGGFGEYRYETCDGFVRIEPDGFQVIQARFLNDTAREIRLYQAAIMATLLQGLQESLP